jgi:GNAT superfamily N-acetyltransferase
MSLADTLVLRALHPADLPAAHRLSASLPWPHRLEDWQALLRYGQGLAACDGQGVLVGTTLWWRYGAAAGSVGMVLVDGARQGMGIGRRLMQAALHQIGPRALMLNATEAGLALYEKLGFRIAARVCQHQGLIGAVPGSEPAAGRIRPAEAADRAAILALDACGLGAERGDFVLNLLGFGACCVVESEGAITGFALRRSFGRGEVIGPMVAACEADAIALVAASLRPGFQRIDIDAGATGLAAWLVQAGLPWTDTATTMYRGAWGKTDPGAIRFALASQAMG